MSDDEAGGWKALRQQAERAQIAAHRQQVIAAWRAAHPEATCSDATVLAITAIEAVGRAVREDPRTPSNGRGA